MNNNNNNIKKLHRAFQDGLEIDNGQIKENIAYQQIAEWDSISHLYLLEKLEQTFDVKFETDEILDMLSYDSICSHLKNKGIEL